MQMEKKYEEALAELEEIVRKMESGEMSIDALTANIKKAKELVKLCRGKLMKTEGELEKVKEVEGR